MENYVNIQNDLIQKQDTNDGILLTPKKIKYGMIGGGPDSFIGEIHRIAANISYNIELVSGCFSSSYEKSSITAEKLNLEKYRIYRVFEELLLEESKMPEEEKIDFIVIVTPNYLHYSQAKLSLSYGFNVLIDKPLSFTYQEALELKNLAEEKNLLLCVSFTYTGYPLIKEAKHIIKSGKLGKTRKVMVEYPQQWLSKPLELDGNKQALWRTDPRKAGVAGCLADIGIHAFNLLEYVSGLKVKEICAEMSTFVQGRNLDDDCSILLRLENGVKAVLLASQVLSGEENSLKINIWGENGSLEWNQKDCNSLNIKWLDKPNEILRAGTNFTYLSDYAKKHCRTPGGHPEGYLEAFANIYRNFCMAVVNRKFGIPHNLDLFDYPMVEDGVRAMLFIEKCVESNNSNDKWTKMI